jgi:hypothetical protein
VRLRFLRGFSNSQLFIVGTSPSTHPGGPVRGIYGQGGPLLPADTGHPFSRLYDVHGLLWQGSFSWSKHGKTCIQKYKTKTCFLSIPDV